MKQLKSQQTELPAEDTSSATKSTAMETVSINSSNPPCINASACASTQGQLAK